MTIKLSRLFIDFFESEKAGGLILLFCTVVSLLISNSSFGDNYLHFWQRQLDLSLLHIDLNFSIGQWINEGLMTIFFLLVGLEIERELYKGELSDIKNATLPIFAAIGGMIVPALLHLSFNLGTSAQSGLGIPMATDIAFALGALSLIGKKVPASLKIFLAALAIIDDLGAVIIIALFYTQDFSVVSFAISMAILVFLLALNRLKVYRLSFYILPGIAMWFFMHKSGVHATITGVLLAFAIPFGQEDGRSPSYRVQRFLHRPVPLLILPIFALANTGILFSSHWYVSFTSSNTLGILSGLVLGKPVGILLFSMAAVRLGLCRLPADLSWHHLTGAGILAGMGFTMSIFITNLAFTDADLIRNSKMAILSASAISGVTGFMFLSGVTKTTSRRQEADNKKRTN